MQPILAALRTFVRAYGQRFSRAKGGGKLMWGCLPLLLIVVCCGVGTSIGQATGVVAIPPTRTIGPTATTGPTATAAPTDTPRPTEPPPATETPTVPPTETTAPTPVPTLAPQDAVAPLSQDDCPPGFLIKGNQGDDGKIYHESGQRSYSATDPEECFATAADAERAGYRSANN